MSEYQPKTGVRCSCKRGTERDNCSSCEGTGWQVDFAAIKARTAKNTFFAINRDRKTATLLPGFTMWEEVQGAFRCGILMEDGHSANGIGRCRSVEDFRARAKNSGFMVLEPEPNPNAGAEAEAPFPKGRWA